MSFTADVKDELSHVEGTCPGCLRAQLSALIRIEGKLSANYRLEIITETGSVARSIVRLLHDTCNLRTEVTTRRSVLHKSYNYLITVPAQAGLEETLRSLGIISDEGIEFGIAPHLVKESCCAAAYLRGAFLGGGFIADPRGSFHFELTCDHERLARDLYALLISQGIPARMTQRRNSWVVYLKGGEPIADFLALTGAHRCLLAMENVRVTKSVRNDVNRRLNAEIANQAKSIDAAFAQIRAIQALAENRGLDSLPPALREIAMLRLSYPDSSLRDLGQIANPPLSKSAVNHRIRRIEELAAPFLRGEREDDAATGAENDLDQQ